MSMSHEECGVFGIYAPGQPVAELTYKGLLALQHRGQDAAGIAVSDGVDITVVKGVGTVNEALSVCRVLSGLPEGDLASGHVRYATNTTATLEEQFLAAQPMAGRVNQHPFVLSQNGHTINAEELERDHDKVDGPVTDGDLITQLVTDAGSGEKR